MEHLRVKKDRSDSLASECEHPYLYTGIKILLNKSLVLRDYIFLHSSSIWAVYCKGGLHYLNYFEMHRKIQRCPYF